ncbi:MAG: metallophosphoesterase [Alphaproteobacteria bacterium]|nr:metallophosphoesterase [Alphaproteobacteria bacterium]
MRILFLGDLVGRSGREAALQHLPALKERLRPDAVIVNGENAAGGYGITGAIAKELFAAGIDCITTGNHVWDQRELLGLADSMPRLLRPLNFPAGTPGQGHGIVECAGGKKLLVINIMARLFMEPLDDPFALIDAFLQKHRLGQSVAAIFVDFHGEASSEKMAFAHFLDGRISAVVGTHTHVPTADAQILPGGTACQGDAGMCGDYDSVIGMKKETAIWRFTRKIPGERLAPAEGEGTVCGTLVVTSDNTGLATAIAPVRIGPRLQEAWPEI